jgi:hypothetical protein
MIRVPEQTDNTPQAQAQPQAQPQQQQSTNNNNSSSGNPFQSNNFGNILGNILNNPNAMIQMTSMIMGGGEGSNMNNNLNNILGNLGMNQNSSGGPINLNNLLQGIMNPSPNSQVNTTNSNFPGQQTQTTPNTQVNQSNSENERYPMLTSPNKHISDLQSINLQISGTSSNLPSLPNLNYPYNVLTAVGNTLNNYSSQSLAFNSHLRLLSELLQSESLVSDQQERLKVRSLIDHVKKGLNEIAQASSQLSNLLNGLEYGNSPGQGFHSTVAEVMMDVTQLEIPSNQNLNNPINDGSVRPNPQINNINNTNNTSNTTNQNNIFANLNTLLNPQAGTSNSPSQQNSSDPFGQMLAEMSQPENMQMMMNMMGGLLGNQANGNQANPLGNMLRNLMGNVGQENNSEVQNTYLNELVSNQNLRKTTRLADIPEENLKLAAEPNFQPLLDILKNLTVQEILDLKNLNFTPISKIRKIILSNLINLKTTHGSKDKVVSVLSQIILDKLEMHENESDLVINDAFILENYITPFMGKIVDLFLDESSSGMKLEADLKKELAKFFSNFYKDLKASYNTPEGAYYFLDCNFEDILIAIIGKDAVEKLFAFDEKFISDFSDGLLNFSTNFTKEENQNNLNNYNDNVSW